MDFANQVSVSAMWNRSSTPVSPHPPTLESPGVEFDVATTEIAQDSVRPRRSDFCLREVTDTAECVLTRYRATGSKRALIPTEMLSRTGRRLPHSGAPPSAFRSRRRSPARNHSAKISSIRVSMRGGHVNNYTMSEERLEIHL
jgi:hypothetical protein